MVKKLNVKRYELYRRAIMIAVALLVGLSAVTGEFALAISSVVIGLLILYSIKGRVEQVLVDERAFKISEKASRRTIQVVGTVTAIVGLIMIVLGRGRYPALTDFGMALTYLAIFLLAVYLIFYRYYSWKFGE